MIYMSSKKPYPRNSDIEEAIMRLIIKNPLVSPDDFPDAVKYELENYGFYTGLVNKKRIWRVYENMVRSGKMYDYLEVVQNINNGS